MIKTGVNQLPRRRWVWAALFAVLAVASGACSTSSDTNTPAYATDFKPAYDPNGPRGSYLGEQKYATTEQVLQAVAAAQQTEALSDAAAAHLVELSRPHQDGPQECFDEREMHPTTDDTILGNCAYGDPKGTKQMVIFGDSRAPMWASTLERVAAITGWQVRLFSRGGCPPPDLPYRSNITQTPDPQCDEFHKTAVEEIRKLNPQLVVATGNHHTLATGEMPTPSQWQDALVSTFQELAQPGTRFAVLGPLPSWENNDMKCLSAHSRDVQACSTERANAMPQFADAERAAVATVGGVYVDTVPWVCAEKCEPVISDIVVYYDPWHFTKKYADYLSGAVTDALKPAMA